MLASVKLLIDKDFEEIKSSSLSLTLCKVYSSLYMKGEQPRTCEKFLLKYYNQIKINGLEMAQNFEQKRTFKVNEGKKGLMYIARLAKHIYLEKLTDAEVLKYIKEGYISESYFIQLPETTKVSEVKVESKKRTKKAK